jgi:hypothetical protein
MKTMHGETFNVGDEVVFGRSNGEQTLGVIVKINPRTYKIRQEGSRGIRPDGTIWRVAKSLVRTAPDTLDAPLSGFKFRAPPVVPINSLDADRIQFPRLLAEISAMGLTDEQYNTLCMSTGLHRRDIVHILDRADMAFEGIKRDHNLAP